MRGLSDAQWSVLAYGALQARSVADVTRAAEVMSQDETKDLIKRCDDVPIGLVYRVHSAARALGAK